MEWPEVIEKVTEFFGRQRALEEEFLSFWVQNVLFTWRWWLKIAMILAPWLVWFLIRKKESAGRLLAAGLFIMAASLFLDEMGVNMGLWLNIGRINPYLNGNTAYNISVLPVAAMLFIQLFPKVKPIFKALAFAVLGAFVFEPLMAWLGYYRNIRWSPLWSFPVLLLMYSAASWIALRLEYREAGAPAK